MDVVTDFGNGSDRFVFDLTVFGAAGEAAVQFAVVGAESHPLSLLAAHFLIVA